jgi:FKBP-type peptidyl-prolyl cis-trans isomerase FklB
MRLSTRRFGLAGPLLSTLALALTATPAAAQAPAPVVAPNPAPASPAVPVDVASYDLGLLLGSQLATNGLSTTVSREGLARGIDAALGGAIASPEQKEAAQQFVQASRTALAAQNADAAHRFLEKNEHASGIEKLPSGLQYRVLVAGDPKSPLPGPQDQITIRYRATLADGTEIDRSDGHDRPAVFRLNAVIKGWREALSAMRLGAKWQVFVPPELGYGSNAPPPIPPGALLVYELELMRIESGKAHVVDMTRPAEH